MKFRQTLGGMFIKYFKISLYTVASKKTGRQNHALTQLKMLYCKTVINIITYHHVV
jgi:hypothetical protein